MKYDHKVFQMNIIFDKIILRAKKYFDFYIIQLTSDFDLAKYMIRLCIERI